jgi:NAD(P)-dependent dehydrogenase (short-subunit alcohol dehydrogenase family)
VRFPTLSGKTSHVEGGDGVNVAAKARAMPRIAADRVGTPDDLTGVAAFLAGRASDYVTGADITVDGGLLWGA